MVYVDSFHFIPSRLAEEFELEPLFVEQGRVALPTGVDRNEPDDREQQ